MKAKHPLLVTCSSVNILIEFTPFYFCFCWRPHMISITIFLMFVICLLNFTKILTFSYTSLMSNYWCCSSRMLISNADVEVTLLRFESWHFQSVAPFFAPVYFGHAAQKWHDIILLEFSSFLMLDFLCELFEFLKLFFIDPMPYGNEQLFSNILDISSQISELFRWLLSILASKLST